MIVKQNHKVFVICELHHPTGNTTPPKIPNRSIGFYHSLSLQERKLPDPMATARFYQYSKIFAEIATIALCKFEGSVV